MYHQVVVPVSAQPNFDLRMDSQKQFSQQNPKEKCANLNSNYNSEIFHWAKSRTLAVSLFLPWIVAALGELGHLECWEVKQENVTCTIIGSS